MARLRTRLVEGVRAAFAGLLVNGDPAHAAPHIISLGFPGFRAEPLLHAVEDRGVYLSAGSACASRDKKPSAALQAIGVGDDVGVLRVSLSRHTTEDDIDRAVEAIGLSLAALRA
jgi:cysteine desulfurase